MQVPERDSTRDWELPEDARPPLLSELVARIDEALATARASEAAVMTVGESAIDAAEQAKRAADLAERASAAMLASATPAPPVGSTSRAEERRQPSRLQRPRRPARGAAEAAAEDAGDPAGVGRTLARPGRPYLIRPRPPDWSDARRHGRHHAAYILGFRPATELSRSQWP